MAFTISSVDETKEVDDQSAKLSAKLLIHTPETRYCRGLSVTLISAKVLIYPREYRRRS